MDNQDHVTERLRIEPRIPHAGSFVLVQFFGPRPEPRGNSQPDGLASAILGRHNPKGARRNAAPMGLQGCTGVLKFPWCFPGQGVDERTGIDSRGVVWVYLGERRKKSRGGSGSPCDGNVQSTDPEWGRSGRTEQQQWELTMTLKKNQ